MIPPLTKKTTDHSGEDGFSFSFFCDCCGKEWISPAVPFAAPQVTVIEHAEAKERIWAEEHRAAFAEANLEAHFHFSNCPQCGSWVCDDCFTADAETQGGLCKTCLTGQTCQAGQTCSHNEKSKAVIDGGK